ncbi:MAG: Unknown protein [uncultured Sulfurovum sp.]|uniref:AraC effector-binding domain-containing protein n=1 Tax=uncultured Sulfurovum sp. TaxID=269237 RepID=A0A6S6SD72_9BACT|nr:MAG: Unknown protein [uncultured Sulfurovum sp.]
MPNIQKVSLENITVTGLQVKTKNIDERNEQTQKIAPLWERFFQEVLPTLSKEAIIYGVYHNYESDAMGEFDVLVGADNIQNTQKMQSLTLQEGQYLMFPVKGVLPQAIIETWVKIWAYFEDESIDERRAYTTDFEKYISKDEAEIYISVNYF